MKDERKTKEALIGELTAARQRIAESAASEATQKREADRLRRKGALDSVRLSVYKMEKASDIQNVLTGLYEALGLSGVVFNECSVQIVDEKREHFTVASVGPRGREYLGPDRAMPAPLRETAVYQAWLRRRPVYRTDLQKEDPYDEGLTVSSACGAAIRSVVDVPFSHGTVAINSAEPNAFSKADIKTVADLADVLSEAYSRVEQIQRIEESEQLHRTVLERSKDVIFQLDSGGNCVLVSPSVRMLTGYPRTRFYANAALWHHIIFPEDIKRVEEGREKALSGKTSREVQFRLRRRNGRVRWAAETAYPVKDPEGRVIAIEGNIRDITRRRHAEQALRESEERYRGVVETQTELVDRSLPDGTLTFVNEACARYFGKKPEEMIGQSFLALVPEEDHDKLKKYFATFTVDNPVGTIENRAIRCDGEIRWQQWVNQAIFDDKGRIAEFQSVGRDVAQRKRAEELLVASQARLQHLIALGPAVIYSCEAEGDYAATFISENVKTQLGYEPQEFVEDLGFWANHIHPADAPRVLADLRSVFKTGHHTHEYRFLHQDGTYRWMHDELRLVRNAQGNPLEIVGCWIDITQRKEAEEELLKYQGQLRSLASDLLLIEERERREFATELHDQVGQALAISKIKLGSLQDITTSPAAVSALDAIRGHIDECIRATRSLTVELSPPVLYELGLVPALDWLAERTQEQIDTPIVFRDDGKPKPLDEDIAVFLFQAARELLVNVGKHAHAREVEMHVRTYGDNVKIIIRDDGVGFDLSEVAPRAHRNGGFGLFGIRERLDYVGGRLEISSKAGHGTQATLIAPLKHEHRPQEGE